MPGESYRTTHDEYNVYKVNEGKEGITYDDLEWKLLVDASDTGTGRLSITYKLTKDQPEG